MEERPDKLVALFAKQRELQEKHMHYDFDNMPEQERGDFIRNYTLYCIDEFSEMLHEIPFYKLWKRYDKDHAANEAKWQLAREEFVDALHFFLNVALALGFTPEMLYEVYMAKNAINIERQKDQATYKPSNDEA